MLLLKRFNDIEQYRAESIEVLIIHHLLFFPLFRIYSSGDLMRITMGMGMKMTVYSFYSYASRPSITCTTCFLALVTFNKIYVQPYRGLSIPLFIQSPIEGQIKEANRHTFSNSLTLPPPSAFPAFVVVT